MVWRTIRRTSRRVSAAIQKAKRSTSAASLAFAAAPLARAEAALASDSNCEAKSTAKGAPQRPRRGMVSVSSVSVYYTVLLVCCLKLYSDTLRSLSIYPLYNPPLASHEIVRGSYFRSRGPLYIRSTSD